MLVKNLYAFSCLLVFFCLITSEISANTSEGQDEQDESIPRQVYFKIDQGLTSSLTMDKKMSNLHYRGFGGILNFGRRAHTQDYIAEWNFLRAQFNLSTPKHENTQVYNPAAGFRYLHLRKLDSLGPFQIHGGGQLNLFTDMRIAPRLGNSSFFADVFGEIRPQAKLSTSFHVLREWNMDFSLSLALMGYGLRIPEYGVIYRLAGDGGVTFQGMERQILTPSNFSHYTMGVFLKESIGDVSNPNWLRIGYVWDYYSMSGNHELNVNNAVHQLVLELYFRVN